MDDFEHFVGTGAVVDKHRFDVPALTAWLVDTQSVSGEEERLANLIDATLRSASHLSVQRDGNVLVGFAILVATPVHTGPRFVAEPSGVAGGSVRLSLPEAGLVGQSGGVHRACAGLRSRVQPPLRPSL